MVFISKNVPFTTNPVQNTSKLHLNRLNISRNSVRNMLGCKYMDKVDSLYENVLYLVTIPGVTFHVSPLAVFSSFRIPVPMTPTSVLTEIISNPCSLRARASWPSVPASSQISDTEPRKIRTGKTNRRWRPSFLQHEKLPKYVGWQLRAPHHRA